MEPTGCRFAEVVFDTVFTQFWFWLLIVDRIQINVVIKSLKIFLNVNFRLNSCNVKQYENYGKIDLGNMFPN
jgi:hypothetical protein